MEEYSPGEKKILLSSELIFFPTPRFACIFEATGKKTFPSFLAYRIRNSRLIQEVLFQFLRCSHPLTRIYYGGQKSAIKDDFSFPFWAMGPDTSDDVYLIADLSDLRAVSQIFNPLIIQEMIEYEERLRFIFVNYQCAGIIEAAPRRGLRIEEKQIIPRHVSGKGRFLENSHVETVRCLEELLRSIQLNDVAVDIGITRHGWYLIELVRPPLTWNSPEGTMNRHQYICSMIESNSI